MTGPELKARRKELGLTMQDVADRVGLVHRQQVYEHTHTHTHEENVRDFLTVLRAFRRAFGLTLRRLHRRARDDE